LVLRAVKPGVTRRAEHWPCGFVQCDKRADLSFLHLNNLHEFPDIRRVKTMTNALLRDVMRKLSESGLAARQEEFERYRRAVNQERHDKNKI
jgi:hypothetical protein